jgi:hypothetical protein
MVLKHCLSSQIGVPRDVVEKVLRSKKIRETFDIYSVDFRLNGFQSAKDESGAKGKYMRQMSKEGEVAELPNEIDVTAHMVVSCVSVGQPDHN